MEHPAHCGLCLRVQSFQPEPLGNLLLCPLYRVRFYRKRGVYGLFQPFRHIPGQAGKNPLKVRVERLRYGVKLETLYTEVHIGDLQVIAFRQGVNLRLKFLLRNCTLVKLKMKIRQADLQSFIVGRGHIRNIRRQFCL